MTDSNGIVTSPVRPVDCKDDCGDGCCLDADPGDNGVEYEEEDADDEEESLPVLKEVVFNESLEKVPKGMTILESFSILGAEDLKSGVLSVGVSNSVTGNDAVVQISRLQIGH